MKISNFSSRRGHDISRIEAQVIWEEEDRPPCIFFVDMASAYADLSWPDPNAFLVAGFFRAWSGGERRVHIDAPICPVLFHNLKIVVNTLVAWYPEEPNPPPRIEAAGGFDVRRPSAGPALSLLTCGIDSLATLRSNKTQIPADHPDSIQAAVMVAFDDQPEFSHARFLEMTAGRMAAASRVGADAGIDIISLRTNVWWPGKAGYFFSEKSHGGIFCALASFFSGGFSKALIASSYDARSLRPWGSHPLLDSRYSTTHFRIEHDGMHQSRGEKIAFVADWPAGLQNIRVCQNDNSGTANCGTCRKCITTMTTLLSLGKLEECQAFPRNNVDAALLGSMDTYGMIDSEDQAAWCRNLIPVFRRQGRDDLADALAALALSYPGRKGEQTPAGPTT